MMWHIYDFRFDKAAKIRADKFAIWWLNISHHAAIFTGPDTWIPQILSCGPLDGCPAVRAAPDYWPDRRENKILNERVGSLEKGWWENGATRPFPSNLITLAEKLGFNVDKFSKITGSSILAGRS
ncbi:MAG: hypothetical protein MUP27_09945 [Desulfobacterales bacterium]|nr:hypothetical protein [Desulfobacterales bacterium]